MIEQLKADLKDAKIYEDLMGKEVATYNVNNNKLNQVNLYSVTE